MALKFNYLSPKVKCKKSSVSGRGIFAIKPVKKNELIAIFGGHVMTTAQYKKLPKAIKNLNIQIENDLHIGPMKNGEIDDGDFVNHSCSPNAGIRGHVALVAMRDIKQGEEIFFDYAMSESIMDDMACKCGDKDCRKIITRDDWKKKDLQKRYSDYFSLYLQEKIDKLV